MDDTEVLAPDERSELQKQFGDWDRDLNAHWSSWRKEARENFDIVAGRSWTKADAAAMEEEGRVATEFNRTLPLIKAVVGAEITGRLRVDYKPRTVGDAKTNEILTSGAEWIREECDAEGEQSSAFMNTLVCGMGWTETRLEFERFEDGAVIEDSIDPLEMDVDPSARKACVDDARYIRRRRRFSRREAKERFGDQPFTSEDESITEHVSNPLNRYDDDDNDEAPGRDEVVITEYQWYDLVGENIVLNPATGQTITVNDEQFEQLREAAKSEDRDFQFSSRKRRVYKRAYLAGTHIIEVEGLPTTEFTYKCITGDYDRNKGVWFGLVRSMKDPQRWANKFFSQILHILGTNAKGGLMIEEDAVEDINELEETWASADSVTVVAPNAIKDGRIKEKTPATYPVGLDKLMETATIAIRDTAGVNPEFLGQADRHQAGVLEHQRKQAAYGIMSTFFDSLRRFRKYQGRLLLQLMRFLPPGTLIRVSMEDWENPQYVPMEQLAKDLNTTRFDVIVGEAPNGPNQKERTFGIIMQLLPMVKDLLTPELWLDILEYAPLPTAMLEKLRQSAAQAAEDPEQQEMKQIQKRGVMLDLAEKEAKVGKTQAETEQTHLKTLISMFQPDPNPQAVI